MSLKDYLYIEKKRLFSNKISLVLNVVLSSIVIVLILFSITVPEVLSHGRKTIKQSLSKKISAYGILSNPETVHKNENFSTYLDQLRDLPAVESVGTWQSIALSNLKTLNSDKDYFQEILKQCNRKQKPFEDSHPNEVQTIIISSNSMKINQLELIKGDFVQESTSNCFQIYLGNNFKDIPVGTVFGFEKNSLNREYVVAGILSQNTTMLDLESFLQDGSSMCINYSFLLDNMILLKIPEEDTGYWHLDNFFSCADGYTYQDAVNQIKELSESLGIGVETVPFATRVNSLMTLSDWLLDGVRSIACLLCTFVLVMFLSTQFLTLLRRKKELGVLVVCGVSKKQLLVILFLENFMKLFFSAIFSVAAHTYLWKAIALGDSVYYELRYILEINAMITAVLICFILGLLVALMPMIFVWRRPLQALVKGDLFETPEKKKRKWTEASAVSFLFLISFVMTFSILTYTISFLRKSESIFSERQKATYEESFLYANFMNESFQEEPEKLFKANIHFGNLYCGIYLPIGNDVLRSYEVDFLLGQNEELKETVSYEDNCSIHMSSEEPLCILGNMFEKETYRENGSLYVLIYGIKCRVIGHFASVSFDGMDERCIAIGRTFSLEELTKCLAKSEDRTFLYKKANRDETSEQEIFLKFASDYCKNAGGGGESIRLSQEASFDSDVFPSFRSSLVKIFYTLIFLCFVNCSFLAIVYGEITLFKNMLKRTLGFSRIHIFTEFFGHFFIYEFGSLLSVLIISFFILLFKGAPGEWFQIIKVGILPMAAVLLGISLLLSLFPMFPLLKGKPASVLKNHE